MATAEELWPVRERPEYDVHLTEDDKEMIVELLVGRRVVDVVAPPDLGEWREDHDYKGEADAGYLRLDNGTVLKLVGNEGGCSCGAGDYYLTELMGLGGVDNIITNVTFLDNPSGDEHADGEGVYKIFIFAENMDLKTPLATFEGTDGNGYYGTGYHVYVRRPKEEADYKALASARGAEDDAFDVAMRNRVRDRAA